VKLRLPLGEGWDEGAKLSEKKNKKLFILIPHQHPHPNPLPAGEGKSKAPSRPAHSKSEIALTSVVAAIAIKFDSLAGAFTRRAAVLAIVLRWTRARRIFTLLFVVSHDSSQPETEMC
jgi:hypothetical protein